MQRIIVNGRFLLHRITGVERYAHEILSELDKIVQPGEIELAVPPEADIIPDYKNIQITKIGKLHNRLWEHVSFPAYVRKKNAISLNLCNVAPLPNPGIVCIHDAKIKACPQYFSKKFILWYNLLFLNATKRAKRIITVSEFSKKELCKYYSVDPNKVEVIPDAWQHYDRIAYDEGALEKYELQKGEYFFSMCSLEPNKNFKWIAEAAKRNPDQVFAVAGSINKTVFADGLGFDCPENMELLGYVSDGEAKTLMRDCKTFLFPTIYEGFGIPPLEAMSAGARSIVVSDTEVMHEIFGDSVVYINPEDYSINIAELGEIPYEKTFDVLKMFSWEVSAKKLQSLLRSISE